MTIEEFKTLELKHEAATKELRAEIEQLRGQRAEIAALKAENERLKDLLRKQDELNAQLDKAARAEMPGAWVCDKCGFILQKNTLHTKDGVISANVADHCEGCPNDGLTMRPLTWREVNEQLYRRAMDELGACKKAEAACAEMRESLKHHHEWSCHQSKRNEIVYMGSLRSATDHALSLNVGTGWLSPEKAGMLRDAITRIFAAKATGSWQIEADAMERAKQALEEAK